MWGHFRLLTPLNRFIQFLTRKIGFLVDLFICIFSGQFLLPWRHFYAVYVLSCCNVSSALHCTANMWNILKYCILHNWQKIKLTGRYATRLLQEPLLFVNQHYSQWRHLATVRVTWSNTHGYSYAIPVSSYIFDPVAKISWLKCSA